MARRFDYTAEPPKPVRKKYVRKPEWIRMNLLTNDSYNSVKKEISSTGLHTVCQEARCPNIHECWGEHKTATYMILGDTCTRRCRFCAVKTGVPDAPDEEEPAKVAASIEKMGIKHAVITMVNRDDMEDG
ncbi:MAG: lipoyl synthase, partial [Gammaproteobacteria bacterium]|nr:lipoyl synthase [Gammaproteobacteria bacterium]NIW39416.1 lipoyl synthase [candidate division Zixibacteria bacterium]NIX58745.1 lipoyl synthase [candidate division Zixibacteria bacterium]